MFLEVDGADKKGPFHLSLDIDNQFDAPGRWLRGNLHCHIARFESPAAACDHYRGLGFDFLAATDHDRVTRMPDSTEQFVTLEGAEVNGGGPHIPCIGLRESVQPADGSVADIARVVREVEAQGGLAILGHPYLSGLGWDRLKAIVQTGMVGMELVNRYSWFINGKSQLATLWHMLLDEGISLAAVGGDDSHGIRENLTGMGWTGVLAREATPRGVMEAIRARRTYASEGPALKSIRIEDNMVAVDCSPCVACHFVSRGHGLRTEVSEEPCEHFETDLRQRGQRLQQWLSICLRDQVGNLAWSSAIAVANEITRPGESEKK